MSDQAESLVPPIEPSIGARATAVIEQRNDIAQELAHALQALDAVLEKLGTHGVSLDTFETDMRQCATIDRQGNKYEVRRRPRAPMGS